jgi:hypothetical protein
MQQPRTVEGTLGTLDKDTCKDNALGKALHHLGRPSVRVSCQVECRAHILSKISMPSMPYLKREITLQGMHGRVLSIRLSALRHACMGIQPHGHTKRTLTDECVSIWPRMSPTRDCAGGPALLIAHVNVGKTRKDLQLQGSHSNMSIYNPKGLPCLRRAGGLVYSHNKSGSPAWWMIHHVRALHSVHSGRCKSTCIPCIMLCATFRTVPFQ